MTESERRKQREFENLFKNPKYARKMWTETVYDRYSKPAKKPILVTDKDGNLTEESQVEQQIWNQLIEELQQADTNRLPTEGEFMEACQSYYSRHNASSYIARRDSMGAKPIDETKVAHQISNPYEDFTDEQLEIMQNALEEYEEKRLLEGAGNDGTNDANASDTNVTER